MFDPQLIKVLTFSVKDRYQLNYFICIKDFNAETNTSLKLNLFSFFICGCQITIVPMHVQFKIHYRNNLKDKKDSYLIPRPPSWDDRNYSYGHQLYPSEYGDAKETVE
jgi:hypothetical protein